MDFARCEGYHKVRLFRRRDAQGVSLAKVHRELDISFKIIDHFALILEAEFTTPTRYEGVCPRHTVCNRAVLRDPQIQCRIQDDIRNMEYVPWAAEPSTHKHIILQQIKAIARRHAPPVARRPKAHWMSESSHAMIMMKSHYFKCVCQHERQVRRLRLQGAFGSWKLVDNRVTRWRNDITIQAYGSACLLWTELRTKQSRGDDFADTVQGLKFLRAWFCSLMGPRPYDSEDC